MQPEQLSCFFPVTKVFCCVPSVLRCLLPACSQWDRFLQYKLLYNSDPLSKVDFMIPCSLSLLQLDWGENKRNLKIHGSKQRQITLQAKCFYCCRQKRLDFTLLLLISINTELLIQALVRKRQRFIAPTLPLSQGQVHSKQLSFLSCP